MKERSGNGFRLFPRFFLEVRWRQPRRNRKKGSDHAIAYLWDYVSAGQTHNSHLREVRLPQPAPPELKQNRSHWCTTRAYTSAGPASSSIPDSRRTCLVQYSMGMHFLFFHVFRSLRGALASPRLGPLLLNMYSVAHYLGLHQRGSIIEKHPGCGSSSFPFPTSSTT